MSDLQTESELAVLKSVVTRLDSSIATMSEVSLNISKLLAASEQRINSLEKNGDGITRDVREVHSRITTMSKEIMNKLDEFESKLEQKIKESNETLLVHINDLQKEVKTLDDRLSFVERWKWSVVGGAMAVGWLIWAFAKPIISIL